MSGITSLDAFLDRSYELNLNGDDDANDTEELLQLADNIDEISDDYNFTEDDFIDGDGGNDLLNGGEGDDGILGGEGFDILAGGIGEDLLSGGDDGDRLFGGSGRDLLFGDEGNDFLNGQGGYNILVGGAGDDTLIGLSEPAADNLPNYYDGLDGGPGADEFRLGPTSSNSDEPFFVAGQKFAVIRDFSPNVGGDRIVLPGEPRNYRGFLFGENNENTAIYYTEDTQLELDIEIPSDIGVGTDLLSVDIPDETALVAVLDGRAAANVFNSDFYEYTD